MIPFRIVCLNCGKEVAKDKWQWRDGCGGVLDIVSDFQGRRFQELISAKEENMGRYARLLPIKELPSVHEGWTPVVTKTINGVEVNFKLEYLSLGGSFKDRGAYVSVAKAKELGLNGIIVDSSGNAGIAFSLMSRLCRIEIHVFISKYAPAGKRELLRLLKANVHEIDGDRIQVNREAIKAEREGLAYVTQWWNPYFIEGVKTMAYETYEQIGSVDYAIAPVGAGNILLGLYKGFKDLVELRALNGMPKIIAVQACGYSAVCEYLGASRECPAKSELADGITESDPPRSRQIVAAVKETDGKGIIVDDEEIKESLVELRELGFVVEPTSATAYVALKQAIKDGFIKAGSRVLLPLTGSGLKMIGELTEISN